jgi:FdhD protein
MLFRALMSPPSREYSMMLPDRRFHPILSCHRGSIEKRDDVVVAEYELDIWLNGVKFISLLCTPRSLAELVTGFLYGEGGIDSAEEILDISINEEFGRAEVILEGVGNPSGPGGGIRGTRTVTTAGGQGGKTLQPGSASIPSPLPSKTLPLDPEYLSAMMVKFSERSELFLATGGVHSCALSDGRGILLFEDDIGRHNALDKIIGHTLLRSMAPDEIIILTSGRVSSEIIGKAARCGIGVIVSRSAPTSRAIELANSLGMTLIGFARGDKFNVYANFGCLKGRGGNGDA